MNNMLLRIIGATALLLSVNGATFADTIGFNPETSTVSVGEVFNVDIVGLDFTALAGGTMDLGFDSSLLQINSVTIDPYFDFFPDGGGPAAGNVWPNIAFDINPIGPMPTPPAVGDFTIATINFTALGLGESNLEVLNSSRFFTQTEEIFPTVTRGTVSAVPIPSAVWLLGSSLLGMIGVARKKITS